MGCSITTSSSPSNRGEVTPEQALEIAKEFASEHLSGYEVVIGTHVDRGHIHSHLVFNSVTCETGEKNTFEELVAGVYEMAMQLGREMVIQALEAQDEELMKVRDKRRYRCKGKQQTSIKTRLGVIEFRRNVYVDNSAADGVKCVHLLDEDLGIERIGQIAKTAFLSLRRVGKPCVRKA